MKAPNERGIPLLSVSRFNVFLAGGGIALAALVAYHHSFSVPFVFDDTLAIAGNPTIRRLWPIWPVLAPPSSLTVGGRPVVNLSLALNYAIGGTAVWGYHAVNLAIHLLAGLTLFGIVRRTLAGPVGAQACCAPTYGCHPPRLHRGAALDPAPAAGRGGDVSCAAGRVAHGSVLRGR